MIPQAFCGFVFLTFCRRIAVNRTARPSEKGQTAARSSFIILARPPQKVKYNSRILSPFSPGFPKLFVNKNPRRLQVPALPHPGFPKRPGLPQSHRKTRSLRPRPPGSPSLPSLIHALRPKPPEPPSQSSEFSVIPKIEGRRYPIPSPAGLLCNFPFSPRAACHFSRPESLPFRSRK